MLNNVTLIGRLTAAPELKTTQSGTPVTSFCIAVDRRYQAKDGEKQADFITCVAWRSTAEFIKRYFGKGDAIALIGEIQTRKYTDKDGNNRTAVEVVVNQASFCGSKNSNSNAGESAPAANDTGDNVGFVEMTIEDDLPF